MSKEKRPPKKADYTEKKADNKVWEGERQKNAKHERLRNAKRKQQRHIILQIVMKHTTTHSRQKSKSHEGGKASYTKQAETHSRQ